MIQCKLTRFVLVAMLIQCGAVLAWPGFNWDEWLKITGATKPEIKAPQAGVPGLLPLLRNKPGDKHDFPTITTWRKKREVIRGAIRGMIGLDPQIVGDRGTATVLSEEDAGDYIRQHIMIPGEVGYPVPAYLLIPKEPVDRPTPCMIVMHQTQAAGKREACGLEGDPEMAFAVELVKRGYICVAPDAFGFGEWLPEGGQPYDGAMDFFKTHKESSYFDKTITEVMQVVTFLTSRGDIDSERIGIIGHSHGAYCALMSAVIDQRISLVVASCGFTTFRSDPTPERWSALTPLMPRLGFFLNDVSQVPFDWHEVLACVAPRPLFYWGTLNDDIFPNTDNLADIYKQLEKLYKLYNMEGLFHGELVPGKHRFPKEGREKAYAWIDKQFGIERK